MQPSRDFLFTGNPVARSASAGSDIAISSYPVKQPTFPGLRNVATNVREATSRPWSRGWSRNEEPTSGGPWLEAQAAASQVEPKIASRPLLLAAAAAGGVELLFGYTGCKSEVGRRPSMPAEEGNWSPLAPPTPSTTTTSYYACEYSLLLHNSSTTTGARADLTRPLRPMHRSAWGCGAWRTGATSCTARTWAATSTCATRRRRSTSWLAPGASTLLVLLVRVRPAGGGLGPSGCTSCSTRTRPDKATTGVCISLSFSLYIYLSLALSLLSFLF